MNQSMYAYLEPSRVPSAEALQATVYKAGFDLDLDADFNLTRSAGYLQCLLDGQATGCEWRQGEATASQLENDVVSLAQSHCISFHWEEDFLESLVAMILSTVLATHHGATIMHGQTAGGDQQLSADELNRGAEQMLALL